MMLAALVVPMFFQLAGIHFEAWDPKIAKGMDRAPHYLKREELLALADAVAPPPSNDDPITRRELDELLALEKARTPAQRRAILQHREFRPLCDEVLATVYRELENAPKTRALLEHVERDASFAVFQTKKKWLRARPHQLEPRLHPAIAVPGHPAYPSAHGIFGHIVARTLAEIFPDYRDPLLAAGTRIGREREIAGVHYPSDAVAGRALGDAIFARLLEDPRFKQDLALAMGEWTCQGK